jgi:quercetin dioxygenase-like cupin family protein
MNDSPARHELLTASLDGRPIERVKMMRVELGPGQAAGRHFHPCPVVGIVLSGSIRFSIAGGPEKTLAPGDAFHEPAGTEIPHFDNASETEPATFLACYLLAPGEDRLIEMVG